MKKLICMVLSLALLAGVMAGCSGSKKTPLADPLTTVIDNIYAQKSVEFMVGTLEIDITDTEWQLPSYTGLASGGSVKEAVASEAMIGSIAYSLVLVRLNEGADAKTVAQQMKDGIDTRKWICVEADDLKVAGYCDVVMLVMVSSEYAESVTAQQMVDAFQTVCGAELDFVI